MDSGTKHLIDVMAGQCQIVQATLDRLKTMVATSASTIEMLMATKESLESENYRLKAEIKELSEKIKSMENSAWDKRETWDRSDW